jgi:hypothetical protein
MVFQLEQGEEDNLEIITICFQDSIDTKALESFAQKTSGILIDWEYSKHKTESDEGLNSFTKLHNIDTVGVLLDLQESEIFTSYPLIFEITNYYLTGEGTPKLFLLLDELAKQDLGNFYLTFSDTWEEHTLVRMNGFTIEHTKEFLNSVYVWCETLTDLSKNEDIRIDDHPLIIKINQ